MLKRLVHLLSENNQNDVWMKIYQKSLELFGRLTAQVGILLSTKTNFIFLSIEL